MARPTRVAVIGCGAIACRIARGIARGPDPGAFHVELLSLGASAHARALRDHGLRVLEPSGPETLPGP